MIIFIKPSQEEPGEEGQRCACHQKQIVGSEAYLAGCRPVHTSGLHDDSSPPARQPAKQLAGQPASQQSCNGVRVEVGHGLEIEKGQVDIATAGHLGCWWLPIYSLHQTS